MPPTDREDAARSRFVNLRGTLTFDELQAVLEPLVERLCELDPEAVERARQDGGGLLRLVAEHLSTSKDFFDAREAMVRRPHVLLRVRQGDWVTVHGWKLRVGRTRRDGQVLTERVDEEGEVLSAAWIDGRALRPEAPPMDLEAMAREQRLDDALGIDDPYRRVRMLHDRHAARLGAREDTPVPPC